MYERMSESSFLNHDTFCLSVCLSLPRLLHLQEHPRHAINGKQTGSYIEMSMLPHEAPPKFCCNLTFISISQVKSFFPFLHCQKVMHHTFWQGKLPLRPKYGAISWQKELYIFATFPPKCNFSTAPSRQGLPKRKTDIYFATAWGSFRRIF